jgi:hypothetical protein
VFELHDFVPPQDMHKQAKDVEKKAQAATRYQEKKFAAKLKSGGFGDQVCAVLAPIVKDLSNLADCPDTCSSAFEANRDLEAAFQAHEVAFFTGQCTHLEPLRLMLDMFDSKINEKIPDLTRGLAGKVHAGNFCLLSAKDDLLKKLRQHEWGDIPHTKEDIR